MERHLSGQQTPQTHITENTHVNLAVLGAIGAVLVSAIWWCSAINTKLDLVIEEIKPIISIEVKMQDHEARIKNLEKVK